MTTDSTKVDEFRKQMQTVAQHGLLSLAIAFGYKLKLFDSLALIASKENPVTAKELAASAGMKERYVQEWLNTMACGSVIEIDESGEKFWIPKERVVDLTGEHPHGSVAFQEFLPIFARVTDQMAEVFRKDGPLGMEYDSYADFYKVQNKVSTAIHKEHLMSAFLPLTGLQAKLEENTTALDVGCGAGFHVCHFAEQFPNTNFTGIDITANAVEAALLTAKSRKMSNVHFMQMDGGKLLNDWTDKFDWVSIFDSCHDQQRPDKTLREIHRVLKPGGVFTMLEINGTSNPYTDRQNGGMGAAYCYAISMFHCLPVASNSEDALGLGSMWGQRRAVAMLNAAGFTSVKVIPTPFFPINVLYLCKKE